MFKKNYIFSFFLVITLSLCLSQTSAQDIYDIAPNTSVQSDTTPPAAFPYPTLFNWNYSTVTTPAVNGGTVGAMYFNNNFYFNRWNLTETYLYDGALNGPQNFLSTLTYIGAIRDMATDGSVLYGGQAGATIFIFDANMAQTGTISIPGGVARALAYASDEDAFFACNFSDDIRVFSSSGTLLRTLTGTAAIAAKYGMAYTTAAQTPGGPYLWVWGQGSVANPFNTLTQLNPQTGAVVNTFAFGPYPVQAGATSHDGIAGGAEVCVINGRNVLLLNHQNYALTGYDMGPVIPVELTSFTAAVIDGNVNLNWRTATELNNHGFEVQRSNSDDNFVTIGFVEGNGTTTEAKNYNFVDKNIAEGSYTYRLKQVDFDGRFEYSSIVEVDFESLPVDYSLNQNFPNPFNPSTKISFTLPVESDITLKIFNVIGEEVNSIVKGTFGAGVHNINFDASNLNSGVYFYSIEALGTDGSSFSEVKKMMLTK